MDLGPDFVLVYTSPDPTIGHLMEGVLVSEGIECVVYGGSNSVYPVTVGSLSEVSIYVRPDDVARARGLIEAAERGDFALGE